MNYTLIIIPLILIIAIYVKYSTKLPKIGHIGTYGTNTKEYMVNYMLETGKKPDYMVKTIRNHLAQVKSEVNRPMDDNCNLYGSKPGSTHNPPAFLYHDKEVWIDSDLLEKKVRAIRKSVEDKGVWESDKINTYINKNTTPYDTNETSFISSLPLNYVQKARLPTDKNDGDFDFDPFGPKSKNPFSNLDGYVPLYTPSPKNYYEFSKDYGFRTYL
jgi:hypothetical protein